MRRWILFAGLVSFYGCSVGFVTDRASIGNKPSFSVQASAGVVASEHDAIYTAGFAGAYRYPLNPHVELSFETPVNVIFDENNYSWFIWPTVSSKFYFGGEGVHAAMKMGMGILSGLTANESIIYPVPRFSAMLGFGTPEALTIGFTAPPFYFWGAYRIGMFTLFGTFTFVSMDIFGSNTPVIGLSGGVALDF